MEHPASPDEAIGLGAQLRSTVTRISRQFRSAREEGDLGDSALAVLSHLEKRGPQTLTELADHDRVAPASMSQVVNRLTSAGLAVRSPDPSDRRKVLFSATAEGADVATSARSRRNAWLDERLDALGDDDRRVIARAIALLDDIADS